MSYNILTVVSRDYPLWTTIWSVMNSLSSLAYQYARLNVMLSLILLGIILGSLYKYLPLPKPSPERRRLLIGVSAFILLILELGLRLGPERVQ